MSKYMTPEEWILCGTTEYCLSQGYPIGEEYIAKRAELLDKAFEAYYKEHPERKPR